MSDDTTHAADRHGQIVPGAHFVMVPTSILARTDISDGAKLLFGVLYSFTQTAGAAFPSMRLLADRLGKTRRTMQREMRELETAQLVGTDPRHDMRGRTSNLYSVRLPGAPDVAPCDTHVAPRDADVIVPVSAVSRPSDVTVAAPRDASVAQVDHGETDHRVDHHQRAVDLDALIAGLEDRYDAALVNAAREACALARRNGKMAPSVWATTLQRLAKLPQHASSEAMRVFVERHADGDKSENYLVAIARRLAAAPSRTARRGVGPTPSNNHFRDDRVDDVLGAA